MGLADIKSILLGLSIIACPIGRWLNQVIEPPDQVKQRANEHGYAVVNSVPISFLKRGFTLNWAVGPAPVVSESRTKLLLVGPSAVKQLHSLSDLAGALDLNSQQEVIDYARLRTSPFTCGCFAASDVWCEVTDESQLTDAFVLGQLPKGQAQHTYYTGDFGIVTHDLFQRAGLVGPVVRKEAGTFVLRRPIVRWNKGVVSLGYATELIGKQGSYTVRSFAPIKSAQLARVRWKLFSDRK